MKKYLIGESATERIELRSDDGRYAMVYHDKLDKDCPPTTKILNEKQLLELYMAIGKAIRKED